VCSTRLASLSMGAQHGFSCLSLNKLACIRITVMLLLALSNALWGLAFQTPSSGLWG